MSELAGLEALTQRKATRYAEPEIEGIGKVRIRSISGSDYAKSQGLKSRAAFAFNEKKQDLGNRLAHEADLKLIQMCWVDANNTPVVDSPDRFEGVDSAIVAALLQACESHCGAEGAVAAGKGSSETSSDKTSTE